MAIPPSASLALPSSTTTLNFSSWTSSTLTSASAATVSSPVQIGARQATSGTLISSSATFQSSLSYSIEASSLGNADPTISATPDSSNEPLFSIGPYICSSSINLSTFTNQLLSFIETTQTTTGAHLLYVIINIHAAAADSAPSSPAPQPSTLPLSEDLLGSLFSQGLSKYIYTPSNLLSERADVNGSWFTVPEIYRPGTEYYSTTKTEYGIVYTQDGWPTESYVEILGGKRLLLGFGSVDPQMASYNFTGDSSVIFPTGYLQDFRAGVTASSSGQVTNGCLFSNGTNNLSQVNSSWVTFANLPDFDYATTPSQDLSPTVELTSNLTNCGISPILNITLLNATASDNYIPYQNYSYSTIWSWAPGEPRNYSSNDASSESIFRCATSHNGDWAVSDCSQKYYASCRANGQPYNWTITTYPIAYSDASQACTSPYIFSAPRTALENSYLTQAIYSSHRDYDSNGVLVDFNSLAVAGCWTTGGATANCPYDNVDMYDVYKKETVLVPLVAVIIVLLLTIMTVFVKVAGNRKSRRRTRNRNNGFVYEGIPS